MTTAAAAHAGSGVVFPDGRVLSVDGVERDGDIAYLTLDGGGRIAVPVERIVNWNDLARQREPEPPDLPTKRAKSRRLAPVDYADLIERTARRHDLDPSLLTALVEVGSAFDPLAVSSRGGYGLTHLMPEAAARFGVSDPFDPTENLEGGARYLSWLLVRFEGRTDLALAAYRSGVDSVNRYRGIPPYRSTRRFVSRVLESANRGADLTP